MSVSHKAYVGGTCEGMLCRGAAGAARKERESIGKSGSGSIKSCFGYKGDAVKSNC